MHELAVCRSLLDQVEAVAHERQAVRVLSIFVKAGPLAGIDPHLLRQAFSLASAGTLAEGSELVVHWSCVRVRCPQCGAESEVASNRLVCPHCANWRTELLAGDELLLERVELQRAGQTSNPDSPDNRIRDHV